MILRKFKYYALGIIASIFILVGYFSRTELHKNLITRVLNQKLEPIGLHLTYENASGFIFSTLYFENISIVNKKNNAILIEEIAFNINYFSTFFDLLTFDLVVIEGLQGEIFNPESNNTKEYTDFFFLEIPVNIKSLFIDGRFNHTFNKKLNEMKFFVSGSFNSDKEKKLDCDILKVKINEDNNLSCDLKNIIIQSDSEKIFFRNIKGEFLTLPVKGQINYDTKKSRLNGELELVEFSFPEDFFQKTPLKDKFSNFRGSLSFESNFKNFTGKIKIENNLDLNAIGEFHILKEEDIWFLKKLKLNGENSELTINGLLENRERINSYINLKNLDLSRWMNDQKETNLSGLLILDASLANYKTLDQIDLTLEILEEKLFNEGEISINGQISYKDSLINTADPVLIFVGDSYLTIDGEGNLKNNHVNLSIELEKADIDLINNFMPGDFISGVATGKMNVNGNINNPIVNSELLCENVKVDDFLLQTLNLSSKIEWDNNLPFGFLDIKAGIGTWRTFSFENGTFEAAFNKKEMIIENCHFKSGGDFFQTSGSVQNFRNYNIDRLQIAYQDNYLVNSKELSFSLSDSTFRFKPFELHINDGTLEGILEKDIITEGHFKMSNFNAKIFTQFINDKRLQVSGLIFGEIYVKSSLGSDNLDFDISLKNGFYMDQEFDEMIISCLFRNGVIHIDDISMTKKGKSGFNITGIYPYDVKKSRMPSISLSSNFSNFPLSIINQYFPKFFDINGDATGTITISGNPKKSNYSYQIEVENMIFDLVELGKVYLEGSYKDNSLFIEKLFSKSINGEIIVSGYIPYNLNIGSSNLGKYFSDDTFDLSIHSKLNNLYLLTPYITDLDSIIGDFDVILELTGKPDEIKRNGKINLINGQLYTIQLGDDINRINGEAIVRDNILSITSLKANIFHQNSKYLNKANTNTKISGEIDISQFFKPDYNLRIEAIEASYRLLFIDITGQANLNLEISGRDTIEISGVIESLDANVFYEFNQEDIGSAIDEENNIVMSYNLNIPLRSSAFFQNSQIDAEILGEISLSQKGHQEVDFGGQIIVEDGNVFSYKDNFDGLQGIVNFDNKGFNPFIDVNANTFIDDERISLRISGGIDDLDIILESGSGFSESDILELLTWGKRFEDQEMTSTGFGNQTVSILGALLENQLEKNLKESSLGMMNYVDDIDIKGAAGLLQGADEDFELTAKRQIGNKTYLNLSYKRSFSLNQDQSQIGVEYKLNRHFSVVGNMDKEGNLNLKYRYRYAY